MDLSSDYKNTEVGDIPIDWDVMKLGDIAHFINGKAHESFISEFGEFIVINSKFISTEGEVAKNSSINLCPLHEGDITMVMSDIPNGKALAKCFIIKKDNKYALNQRICALKPYTANNEFLSAILNRNKYFLAFDSGTGQTNLRRNEVLRCPVPLPPLPEQKAIAEVLSNTDNLIQSLEKQIEKKRMIKQGAIQKLLYPKEGWKQCLVGDLGKPYGGLSGKSKSDFSGGDSPYIPFMNIMSNPKIDISYLDYVKLRPNESQNKAMMGDLFFNGSSETPEEVGMCSVLIDDVQDLYLNSFCFGFRLSGVIKSDGLFLSYYFRSTYGRKHLYSLAQGATRYNLSKTNFMKMKISLPSYDEQVRISAILSDLDNEIELMTEKVKKYQFLKKGLMQNLLTGKIRLKLS